MSDTAKKSMFSFATGTNAAYLEEQYELYKSNPDAVEISWKQFFQGYEFAARGVLSGGGQEGRQNAKVEALVNVYRRLGHLHAHLNPLEDKPPLGQAMEPESHGLNNIDLETMMQPANLPLAEMKYGDILKLLQETYCRTLGADFREINDIEAVVWFQRQMETCRNQPELTSEIKKNIHQFLTEAEGFERFLQDRYLGQKRFSLEGNDSLMPLLHFIADYAAEQGGEEINIGMAHRGRLNVLANFMGKKPELILKEFEGAEFNAFDIDGDVKYHMGFASQIDTMHGHEMRLFLLPNPSHLEAVNPVVEGFARGRQASTVDVDCSKIIPIIMHGDAAFMGQGVVAETLNLAELSNYNTGGTIHIIINNQIGFTADANESRSCTYSSEIAKMIRAPVLHVNADDPEAVSWTAKMAVEFRQRFGKDIVIDLIGYRRHGHNETDEPMFTQPLMYKDIRKHPTCLTLYTESLVEQGVIKYEDAKQSMKSYRAKYQSAMESVRSGKASFESNSPEVFQEMITYKKVTGDDLNLPVKTSCPLNDLKKIAKAVTTVPEGFSPHPKIEKLLESRQNMMTSKGTIDWGMAEMLAFGALAREGHPVRLSGQDCQRGTFSHRHAVLKDFENGQELRLLNQVSPEQAPVEVINSPLSEAGVLGFEFGYSVALREGLTAWEAQFGDFANGAQILIDQFLVASEAKWKQTSGLVLMLPHGYEGQGPEHSNARPERFLQLCGDLNIQLINPTTPSQLFHALRRQVKRSFRKPLVVMTPKSLLRHPEVISSLDDFSKGSFTEIIVDQQKLKPENVRRVVLCSGKIFYELQLALRNEKKKKDSVALVRIEQLYPFPAIEIHEVLEQYPNAEEVYWTQEEPMNMGAWFFVRHRLDLILEGRKKLQYVGRKGAGSTAEGSNKAHQAEQKRIIGMTLGIV
jgi:2-oxoglutarate dehydrogenase E1 component